MNISAKAFKYKRLASNVFCIFTKEAQRVIMCSGRGRNPKYICSKIRRLDEETNGELGVALDGLPINGIIRLNIKQHQYLLAFVLNRRINMETLTSLEEWMYGDEVEITSSHTYEAAA